MEIDYSSIADTYTFDQSQLDSIYSGLNTGIEKIKLASKVSDKEDKEEKETQEKEAVASSTLELPEGYTISTRRRGTTDIVDLLDADGNTIKTYSSETSAGMLDSLKLQATEYANERYNTQQDSLKRNDYKESIEESLQSLSTEISRYEKISNEVDLSTTEGQSSYYASQDRLAKLMEQQLTLSLLQQQMDMKVKDAEGKEKDKWGLKDVAMVLGLVASGLSLGDSITKLFSDDEIENIDIQEELRKATEAQTDPEIADRLINAGYRDQPRITDLESIANYRNQFGSLTNEMFNDPQYGEQLEQAYQDFLIDNPDVNRDQFLTEFAEANPTNPLSQKIQTSLSRTGQLAKSSQAIFDINAGQVQQGFDKARDFYKPLNEGGMGYRPDDFRSQEQKDITSRAMGLVNNPDMQLLKDSIGRRVRQQGELGTDELRDITGSALTSVDPSLQNQAYLRSGGLARSILNTSGAMRNRLVSDEAQYAGLMGEDRANVTTANNVIASNTINPAEAFGLKGTNTTLANQIYSSNPTQGLNYDPTGQYFSSLSGANANINQANMLTPGMGSKASNVANDAFDFADKWEQYSG